MPCYADTIVRIKHVRRNKKEDSGNFSVWAIGTYPVECEIYEIEMTLPIPINPDDRDPDSQAVFQRDEYYSIGGKVVPGSYAGNRRLKMMVATSTHITLAEKEKPSDSNRCPLKVSLVGIPQAIPIEIKNTESSVFEIIVSDYIAQPYNYIIKVVYPHINNQFKHFKTSIRPHESVIFVIGQLEIIDNEFYVYAREINYVDMHLSTKKKDYEINNNEITSLSTNTTRSKLLYIHKNVAKNSGDTSEFHSSTSTTSEYFESIYQDDLSKDIENSEEI
ncbi:18054_t:CDS:2 [Dentiscutata erythropus]|uniref:18054_t:CDS:1 n=1 Tax=Dentiscutata erythropus TaxID=1348616 RepID=A0A9N8VQR7_9GLOM|nr:18054_t:CDS:2 [Dentiscutata erythropus]